MSNFAARISLFASPMIRYFRLRPALAWSIFSFIILLVFLLMVRFNSSFSFSSYSDISRFEMVEFVLDSLNEPEPEIEVSDTARHQDVEEKFEFGDSRGAYGQLTRGATPPRPVFSSLPEYPLSMKSAGIEGVVVLELGIDEKGNVLYGRVVRSLGREFDKAAIEWAQTNNFYPALDPDNKPFACRIYVPLNFKLDN